MSAWAGKHIIGLTGNIATGKSVVRKMLEHLGAYGIDADALGHRAIARGAPGYQNVVDTFGSWVVGPDGQINRTRLAKVVFSDPEALAALEAIIHPLVGQAIDILIRRSAHKVIVIEAIKLIESGLSENCDTLWVTFAPMEVQLGRLMQKRGMDEISARQRILAQPPQEEKRAKADIVIRNDGTYEETWRQVVAAWQDIVPEAVEEEELRPAEAAKAARGEMVVTRARPRQADEIAALITRLSGRRKRMTRSDIMAAFGEKAYLLLKQGHHPVGLVGWKVENLVARTDEVFLEPHLPTGQAVKALMEEVETFSRELQCEISLLFLSEEMALNDIPFRSLGYQKRSVKSLGVRAWQEAAIESQPPGTIMFFKQLRADRVLRPV